MSQQPVRLVLSAGETSGDQIAGDLALALKQLRPDIELAGITGPRMRAAGVTTWHDLDELNVMGLTEVVAHLPRLLRLRREFGRRILAWQPAVFVGIDAPDFNLGLARKLRARGLRTIHYVSPSVWAWRAHRIAGIARSLDLLLTLFPFEPSLYRPYGLEARFVGHHLADRLAEEPSKAVTRTTLQLDPDAPIIALLPGSRAGELKRHGPLLGHCALALRQQRPEVRLLMLLAEPDHEGLLQSACGRDLEQAGVRIICAQTRAGLRAADVAVAASGTVTLEAFLLGCPLVVYYRLPAATYWLARSLRLVKSRHVSLPNILDQRELVPEHLQHQATAERLATDALSWLDQPDRRRTYQARSEHWQAQLATDASAAAARAITDFIQDSSAR